MRRRSPLTLAPLTAAVLLVLGAAACDEPGVTVAPADAGDATAASDTAAAADTSAAADTGPAPIACNILLQQGCEATENCTYPTPDATDPSCAPEGTKLYGQECAGLGDCQRGICLDLNDTGSRCYKFCKTEIHCAETVGADALAFTGGCSELSGAEFKVCGLDVTYVTCDLLAQGCEPGKGCYLLDTQPVCLPAGSEVAAGTCASSNDCAPGGVCINTRCKRLCDTSAGDPCGGFIPCTSYWGQAGYCDE